MAVENLQEHAGHPSLENLKQAARIGNRVIFEKAATIRTARHGAPRVRRAGVPGADGEGDEIDWIKRRRLAGLPVSRRCPHPSEPDTAWSKTCSETAS